jgi:hypothetical protein
MSLLSVCAGDGDIASSVLTLFVIPIDRAFLSTTMSKNYINHIGTYNDNHKEITINGANVNVSDLVRSFMADDIEPVQAEEVTPSNLPFLVVSKLQDLNLYSLQEFEGIYRKAVEGDAKTLASFLKKYRDLQVLDFKDKNKKQIFAEIEDFFGDSITYKYPNFAAYF